MRYVGVMISGAFPDSGSCHSVDVFRRIYGERGRTRVPGSGILDLRTMEAARHPAGHLVLRICHDGSQRITGHSVFGGNPAGHSQDFPLCCHTDRARDFLQILECAESRRGAVRFR